MCAPETFLKFSSVFFSSPRFHDLLSLRLTSSFLFYVPTNPKYHRDVYIELSKIGWLRFAVRVEVRHARAQEEARPAVEARHQVAARPQRRRG